MTEKIMITGIGLLTPLGLNTSSTWKNLIHGQSGIRPLSRLNPNPYRSKIAGEIPDSDPPLFSDYNKTLKIDRIGQYILHATQDAMRDAQLTQQFSFEKTGVIIGTGLGGLFFAETQLTSYYQNTIKNTHIHPFTVPFVNPNSLSTLIAKTWQCKGPNLTICTACASGTHAIGQALDLLRLNKADRMIVGGAEAPLMPLTFSGFDRLRVLSTHNTTPKQASRPFDKHRDGFVMGEGAGILILEKEEIAQKRGVKGYAELAGYGATNGCYNLVKPLESGADAAQAIKIALNDAKCNPQNIHYINAHGTATPLNDKTETAAIKAAFQHHAPTIPISSTKSQTGHLIGAAGAIEAAFTALALHHQVLPATLNQSTPDPDCDLDYIPNHPRKATCNAAISQSFGFGNNNAVIVLKKTN